MANGGDAVLNQSSGILGLTGWESPEMLARIRTVIARPSDMVP